MRPLQTANPTATSERIVPTVGLPRTNEIRRGNEENRSANAGSGRIVGEWRLVELLAEGTHSFVFSAQPATAARSASPDYAVKIAKSDVNRSLAIQLLSRQIAASREIVHPNIVPVLAADLTATTPFLVMPLIRGTTLDRWLSSRGVQPLPVLLWFLRQIAQSLDAIHHVGWVHGDLRPQNIMIDLGGQATLIDLAFSANVSAGEESLGKGTIPYSAPERWLRESEMSPASDIYSLGIIGYEILTGSLPAACGTEEQYNPANLQISANKLRHRYPQAPASIEKVIYRLLAKQPLRRPQAFELIPVLMALEIETFGQHIAPPVSQNAKPSAA